MGLIPTSQTLTCMTAVASSAAEKDQQDQWQA